MKVLVTKDGATKVPREVKDLAEARTLSSQFHVELLDEEGNTSPLPEESPPADDAHVAVGSTRFSDGEPQTEETLAAAQAAPAAVTAAPAKKAAKKAAAPAAPVKKSAPAKKAPAKKAKR